MLQLFCPIPEAIHPEHELVSQAAMTWLETFDLIQSSEQLKRFEALRIPEFVARAYPHAELDDLRVVLDWTCWGFMADDQHDDLVREPELLRGRYLAYVATLEHGAGAGADAASSGPHRALNDLRERILERGTHHSLQWFVYTVREWFDSLHWETLNRVRAKSPLLPEYLSMRDITVGMYTEYALFDVTHRMRTTPLFHCDPDLRRLMVMSANIIGWANDIFSSTKERRAGDPHNLVLLLGTQLGLSDDAARILAHSMHDQEMRRFLELEAQLRQCPPSTEWVAFIDLMRAWIRANVDWALATSRYELCAQAF